MKIKTHLKIKKLPFLRGELKRGLFICILFFLLSSTIYNRRSAFAQSFTSDNFQIQWGNFNTISGTKTSASYKLTDTVGQNAPGKYQGTSSNIESGFQYFSTAAFPLSFKISKLSIDLGTLVSGVGATDVNTITISSPGANGYEILVHENHPLSLDSGTTIPDTKCDNGNCTESDSEVWTNANTYGFGFNILGIDANSNVNNVGTSNYFFDATYFRQFADFSSGENNQIIMSETSSAQDHMARVTYKANISSVQSAGDYQNAITFIAIPKY